jgi:hypothetical protein
MPRLYYTLMRSGFSLDNAGGHCSLRDHRTLKPDTLYDLN